MSVAVIAPVRKSVGMGQAFVARAPDQLTAVLGSCIGVAIYQPRARAGALAHVVLPSGNNRAGVAAKFADTAVPHLVQLLAREGIPTNGLKVKITGGANMFATQGPMQIGELNIAAIRAALAKQHLKIDAEHLGGNRGRRIAFDLETGCLTVECPDAEPIEL